jgi:GT2 family glycosyltransferase
MSDPCLSILLVNYNGLAHLEECLSSIDAQSFRDFEVVMVDNASKDGSVAFVTARFPWVKIVPSGSNLGFAGGNNLGIPHCRGRNIFFLNNDTRLADGALAELDKAIRENPANRVFACFLVNYSDPTLVDSAGDCVYSTGPTFSFSRYPVSMFTEKRLVISPCAGAAVYGRDVLDKIGLFDEDFFLNFEDLDLGFRAQHAGEKILFLPDVKVYHKGSATLGGKKSPVSTFYAEKNYGLFLLKNFPAVNLIRFIPAFLFVKSARFVSLLLHGSVYHYLRGNWAFLKQAPLMLAKRKKIMATSVLSSGDFDKLLRKNWFRERLAWRRGNPNIPL